MERVDVVEDELIKNNFGLFLETLSLKQNFKFKINYMSLHAIP